MNFIWQIARVMGIAAITAGGIRLLIGKFAPNPADLIEGAVHFRNGVEEFQKGLSSVLYGSSAPAPDKLKQAREATRISIE
jgi:hypothetical protein